MLMFVTNLTKSKLGVNGKFTLKPGEANHFVDDTDASLVARISRLERAKLVSVVRESGLTKTGLRGTVVKTLGADIGALTNKPRSLEVKEESAEEKDAAVTTTDNGDGTTTTITRRRSRRKKEEEETTEETAE